MLKSVRGRGGGMCANLPYPRRPHSSVMPCGRKATLETANEGNMWASGLDLRGEVLVDAEGGVKPDEHRRVDLLRVHVERARLKPVADVEAGAEEEGLAQQRRIAVEELGEVVHAAAYRHPAVFHVVVRPHFRCGVPPTVPCHSSSTLKLLVCLCTSAKPIWCPLIELGFPSPLAQQLSRSQVQSGATVR